ncbi:hypothetical protein D9M72_491090 [compost metagenome]
MEARVGRLAEIEADVERAAAYLLQHPPGHAVAQLGADLRVALDQRAQRRSQPRELRIEDGADRQPPAHRVMHGIDGVLQVAHAVEDALGQRQQRSAIRSQRQAGGGAFEQLDAPRRLQRLELEADRGLGQVQALRGAGQIAFACDGDECAQMVEVQGNEGGRCAAGGAAQYLAELILRLTINHWTGPCNCTKLALITARRAMRGRRCCGDVITVRNDAADPRYPESSRSGSGRHPCRSQRCANYRWTFLRRPADAWRVATPGRYL